MLVLRRKVGEKIMLSGGVSIEIIDIEHGKVRLGFEAPDDVVIDREEVFVRKTEELAGEGSGARGEGRAR